MALDPRIPLGAQVAQVKSPLVFLREIAQLQDAEDARLDRDLQRQQRQKQIADQQALRDVFAKTPRRADGTLDRRRIASEAGHIDPNTALELEASADREEVTDLQKRNAELDNALKTADFLSQRFGGVAKGDQRAWATVLEEMRKRKLDTTGIPDTYDEGVHKSLVEAGLTYKDRINAEIARIRQQANLQKASIKWQGKKVNVPFNPDTGLYHMPDGTFSKFAEEWTDPNAGGNGSHWVTVEEEQPDGSIITRTVRAGDGTVIKRKPKPNKDNPKLPRGAVDYFSTMRAKAKEGGEAGELYDVNDALNELDAAWPELVAAHPNIDRIEAEKSIRELFADKDTPFVPRAAQRPAVPGTQRASRSSSTNAPIGSSVSTAQPSRPATSQSMPTKNATAATVNPALRAEAAAVLSQFKAEQDPARKAALHKRLVSIRQQMGQR